MAPSLVARWWSATAFIAGLLQCGVQGSFLPNAEVLMADGKSQMLEGIRVGDQVLSWDEAGQQPVISTVRAISREQRAPEELFELRLPTVSVAVSKDHPLWSRSRHQLVSQSPNATWQAYSFTSEVLLDGEILEGPDGGQVTASIGAVTSRVLSQAQTDGATQALDVLSLCLHPYHWYFVHGIRVHNKGCFKGSAQVTMADGSSKPLQDIRVGDAVSSWNEAAGKADISTVRAVPIFERDDEDLVELQLPSASFLVTQDHPFWSSSEKSLVSAHPNETFDLYNLPAAMMRPGQILEGLQQEEVPVVSLRRSLLSRRLKEGARAKTSFGSTRVMTLCLRPHHWYYVHGVRVHNKGCFEASAEVTMADGSSRALGEIRVGDVVSSFDETAGTLATSAVRAVPKFQRSEEEMVEIHLPGGTLRATEDHPFWSRTTNGLVSSSPSKTRELYNLSAHQMEQGQLLEGLQQEEIPVVSVRRALLSRRLGEACNGANCTTSVMTLCLEPHHWFYVKGVRVHNKGSSGCFTGNVEVTMADRSIKRLDEVRVGDAVASWDEVAERRAISTVKAVPEFARSVEDLIEIELPTATFRSTEDHPFWSSSQQCLVSAHPNQTLERYDLKVALLQEGEHLQGLEQEDVPVKSIRRQLLSRRLDTEPEGNSTARVLTLALEPHHWFYVHGVRVHNKGSSSSGCFAPWTPILVPGGGGFLQKPISEIRLQDTVISWDDELGQLSEATVIGIDVVQPTQQMFEILLNGSSELSSSKPEIARRLLAAEPQGLVLTADHPVYSSRTGGLVSISPSLSSSRYGLEVSQMEQLESLHHHLGHQLQGHVRPWSGQLPKVLTLRLDRHHWFFAQGVRVHNKGSSGGSSSSSSSGGSSSRRSYSARTSWTSYRSYSYFAVGLSTRRRWGYYNPNASDDDCIMVNASQAMRFCKTTVSPNASDLNTSWFNGSSDNSSDYNSSDPAACALTAECCADCLLCNDTECVDDIYNCDLYLSQVYIGCYTTTTTTQDYTAIIIIASVFGGIFFLVGLALSLWFQLPCWLLDSCNSCCNCGCGCCKRKVAVHPGDTPADDYNELWTERNKLTDQGSFPLWAEVAQPLTLQGSYTENGSSTYCSYSIQDIGANGVFKGTGTDDDGTAEVHGAMSVLQLDNQKYDGIIRWQESRPGATMEVWGSISVFTDSKTISIAACYTSTFRWTKGNLQIEGSYALPANQDSAAWVGQPAGTGEPTQIFGATTVVGQPVQPTQIGAAQEGLSSFCSDNELLDDENPLPPADWKEFTIVLTKDGNGGHELGMDLGHSDKRKTLLVSEVKDGLVANWNQANPDQAVQPEDLIVEANGVRGDGSKILEVLRTADVLTIVIQRGGDFV